MGTKDFAAIIDLAISKEEEAYDFYMELVKVVDDKAAKDALQYIAAEEKKHKEFLVGYREKGYGDEGLALGTVVDYKIAEHLETPGPKAGMENKESISLRPIARRTPTSFTCLLPRSTPRERPKTCS